MSLIIAQVHKNHALLVTDTRGCIDDRPVTDEIKKVYPLGRGFFSSGPGVMWGDWLYEHLRKQQGEIHTLSDMVEATKAWASQAMHEFEAKHFTAAQLVRDVQTNWARYGRAVRRSARLVGAKRSSVSQR